MFQNLTRDQSAPLRGWAGSLATRGNFWPFLVIATLSLVSSGENPKNVKDCFSSTGSEFQSLRRNRFWHQILRSEVTTPGLLGASGFTSGWYYKKTFRAAIYNPKGLRKKTPFNFTIKLYYRFKWFTIFLSMQPQGLLCRGFGMDLVSIFSSAHVRQ